MKTSCSHINYEKKWILLSLFTLICFGIFAQKSDDIAVTKFQKLDLRNGLSNLNIPSIIQDDLGFIWMASARGVNRFDGNSFKHYFHSEDENSLFGDMVVKLHKNNEGLIFCSTIYGINAFDTKKNKMYRISNQDGSFIDLIDSHDNTYGISFISGLCVYNKTSKAFERLPHLSNDRLLNYLISDEQSGIWACSVSNILTFVQQSQTTIQPITNQILVNYNPKTDEFRKYIIPGLDNEFSNGPIVKIDSLLVLSGKVFNTFNINTSKFVPFPQSWSNLKSLSELEITCIELIDENTLWIGTRTKGLFIFNLDNNTLNNLNSENSDLNSNFIRCIFKDRDNNIWIGTFEHGVNIALREMGQVNSDIWLNKLTDGKFINSITSDKQNNYYIGSRNEGLYVYNSSNKSSKNYNTDNSILTSNHIRTVFVDSQSKIWIADQKALHIIHSMPIKSNDFFIEGANEGMGDIIEHEDKIIASSDAQGFFIFDIDGRLLKHETRLGFNISQIIARNKDELIVASYSDGIYSYKLESETYRKIYSPIKSNENNTNQIITIYLDNESILWIGNYMKGLHRLDLSNNSVSVYTTNDGLSNNDIVGIAEDSSGYLWLSTSYGISRFDKKHEFVNFYYNVGLENLQFHAKSTHVDNNGFIFFGGCNGLSYFDPKVLSNTIKKEPATIILKSLNVQNKEVDPEDGTGILSNILNYSPFIKLKHNQNNITIEYHAFDFVAADEIRYSYILEGLDKNWYDAGKRSFANYSNLRPGNYTFKVKAKNIKGVWSDVSLLNIKIKPSPFLTIWALIFYSLLLTTIISVIFQLRLKAKLFKNRLAFEHNERVRENEVAEMKMRFFTNISHEILTPLTLIKGNVDLLSNELAERNIKITSLNGLLYSTNRLLSLVNQLLLVRKLENDTLDLRVKKEDIVQITNRLIQPFIYLASIRKISISVESDSDKLVLPIDEDKYEKIMSNLLSNSIKHVNTGGLINIRIEKLEMSEIALFFDDKSKISDDLFVMISVIDNGVGIPQEDIAHIFDSFSRSKIDRNKPDYSGTGIGLNFTKKLVELHHGAIRVSSEQNVETVFSFVLPLNEKNYKKDTWIKADEKVIPAVSEKHALESSEDRINSEKELILLVEDDLELNRFISSSLKKHFKVISAYNGKDGINLALNQLPNLIISDIMMPEMDGFELCRHIRKDDLISHIPIILLTAKSDIESKIEGYNYGADDYISKPFEHAVLIARIKNLIESRKKLQTSYKQGIMAEHQADFTNQFELNFVKRIEAIVSVEYHSPKLNVNSLADQMNMSRTNFYRKFMSVMDISPKEFITKYRINKSIELMKSGNDNFGEISDLCGFGSQSNYSAIFKKEKGITPLQFKQSL